MMLFRTIKSISILCLLISTSTSAQKMAFGKNSFINYQSSKGTFDVVVNGKQVLRNGFSEVLVNSKLISSKDYKHRSVAKRPFVNETGNGELYILTTEGKNGISLKQSIFAYGNHEFFVIEVAVNGRKLKSNKMFPLKGELVGVDNFLSCRSLFVPFDNDAFVSYEANLLALNRENISAETTSIYNNENRKGFVIGTLDHDIWKTGLRTKLVHPTSLELVVECGYTNYDITRDKIEHGYVDGSSISSSKILFGYFNDWRIGMETYAKTIRANEKPIVADWRGPTPVGWNSWGVMQERISYEKAIKVVDFFADNLKSFRIGNICYIDLDSYWDNLINGDDYSVLTKFADYCKSKGLKPGIYWAPFTDWGFQNGADRKAPGSEFTFGEMWTKVNQGYHDFDGARALDPTHPGTKKRIEFIISKFKKSGFEMIKIDFLGHAAVESTNFYDPKITTGMQAYRVGMEYLLKCLDNKMLVYAAISPSLASGRYVQVRRIACDAFKSIKDTEYTLNGVTNGWWQTYLYDYIDADHVVLADEGEHANISRTLSAIVTGTLFIGDDFSLDGKWKGGAKKLFENQGLLEVISDGKAFRPVDGDNGKGASAQYVKECGNIRYIALFNYENKAVTSEINFSRLGFAKADIASMRDLIESKIIKPQEYHSMDLKPSQATMFKITLK
ncbi:alpha-galactosidase [Pedobacter sp. UYEF25]